MYQLTKNYFHIIFLYNQTQAGTSIILSISFRKVNK
jgi:hypothetical protein